jgi:predicted XRE-type DNA-binding protein
MAMERFENAFNAIVGDNGIANESAELTFRADMMLVLRSLLEEKNLSQARIGELLGIPQPRVSELMCGKLAKLSAGVLIGYLDALGYRIKPTFESVAGRKRGSVKVVVVRH